MTPVASNAVVSPAEQTKHARELLHRALARSEALCGDYGQLDELVLEARLRGLSWGEGLEYALVKMG